MSQLGTGAGATTTLAAPIGTTDLSYVLAGPLSIAWPTSGLVVCKLSETEIIWGTISGTTVTVLSTATPNSSNGRAAEKYKTFSTPQTHAAGDTVELIASWGAWGQLFPSKIDEAILAATTASVTFPNLIPALPTWFRQLRIVYVARTTSATNGEDFLQIRFNGDAGPNYEGQRLVSNGGTTTSADQPSATQANVGIAMGGGSAANAFAVGEILIPNYGVAIQRLLLGRAAAQNGTGANLRWIEQFAVEWNSTAPITSITLLPSAGSFAALTAFTLTAEP